MLLVRVLWLLLLLAVSRPVQPTEPLEKLDPRTRDLALFHWHVRWDVPPPTSRGVPASPDIAALVRAQLGPSEVTLFRLAKRIERDAFVGYAVEDTLRLESAETERLVALMSSHEWLPAADDCTCGALGVRIMRADELVDFVIDCGEITGDSNQRSEHVMDLLLPVDRPWRCENADLAEPCRAP